MAKLLAFRHPEKFFCYLVFSRQVLVRWSSGKYCCNIVHSEKFGGTCESC